MRDQLSEQLQILENELRAQGRWDMAPPSPQALRSNQPFAFDTLSFDQWLQWILLPKMRELVQQRLPLPANCAIEPMAEEVYRDDGAAGVRLVRIIGKIDGLLSTHAGRSE